MDNKKINCNNFFDFAELDTKFVDSFYWACSKLKVNGEGSSLLEDIGFYSYNEYKSEGEYKKDISDILEGYKKYLYPQNCDDKKENCYIGFNIEPYFCNIYNKENLINLFIALMIDIRYSDNNASNKNKNYNVKENFFNNLQNGKFRDYDVMIVADTIKKLIDNKNYDGRFFNNNISKELTSTLNFTSLTGLLVNNISCICYTNETACNIRQATINARKSALLNAQPYNHPWVSNMFCMYWDIIEYIPTYINRIHDIIVYSLKKSLIEDSSGKKAKNLIEYIKNFKVIPENAEPVDPCLDFYTFLRIKYIKETYRVFRKIYSELYSDPTSNLYNKSRYEYMKDIWGEIKQNPGKYINISTAEEFYNAYKDIEKKYGKHKIFVFGEHTLRYYLKKAKEATAFEGSNSLRNPYVFAFAYLSSLYYVINEDQYKIMSDFAITFSDLVINKILLDTDNSSGFSQEAGIIYGRIESFYTYILNYQKK